MVMKINTMLPASDSNCLREGNGPLLRRSRSTERVLPNTNSTRVCGGDTKPSDTKIGVPRTSSAPMKLALHCRDREVSPPPSPLCRWSSLHPREISPPTISYSTSKNRVSNCSCKNSCWNTPSPTSRSRYLRAISMVPPHCPTRRFGSAEELRSALPPKVPQRKPGDAEMEPRALPPYMPKRKLDDSCELLSLISSLSSKASSNDQGGEEERMEFSFDDDISALSDDISEGDPLHFEGARIISNSNSSTTTGGDADSIKANLQRVIGEVLEGLDFGGDEGCF